MTKIHCLTKTFLIDRFITRNNSVKQIAAEIGCSASVISKRLILFGIKKTRPDKYIGRRFGLLVVEEIAEGRAKRSKKYLCRCDCGNTTVVVGYSLGANTKSCGCLKHRVGKEHFLFRGYEELGRTWWTSVIQGAEARDLEVRITIEDAWELFISQNRKCAYTGLYLSLPGNATAARHGGGTASLDRIDSSKGYVPGNVQWVHKAVNIMKLAMKEDVFISWCVAVGNGPKSHLAKEVA